MSSRLRQLALEWQQRASEDALDAQRYETIRASLGAMAHTRRNCAWELLKILNTMEKESPLEGGSLSPRSAV